MEPWVYVLFPPFSASGAFSSTKTLAPFSLAEMAAHIAAFPAPITTISVL
jgi:hypothetical protein